MKSLSTIITLTAFTLSLFGCDSTDQPSADAGADLGVDAGVREDSGTPLDSSFPSLTVLNSGDEPLAAASGPPSVLDSEAFIASTSTTIVIYRLADGRPDARHAPLVLTSTQAGGNAAGPIAVYSGANADFAFFLPTGLPQVGVVSLGRPARVITEDVLAGPLGGGFSADLSVRASTLYVVDAPFGQPSVVRAFDLAGFQGAGPLQEDLARRFPLPVEDFDGDGGDDTPVAGRLQFSSDGTLGFVAFTILGNSAPALAGGLFAFDPNSGLELGRVLVPTAGSSTIAQGFVSGFVVSESKVFVVTAEKKFVPSFEELGGHLSVYEITSRSPFAVKDLDAQRRYHQPSQRLSTSDDNPVGLAVIGNLAMVVNAPFFLDGSLDVFGATDRLSLLASHPLGGLYRDGFFVPADPKLVPGTRRFLLGTEAGTLQFEVGEP